MHVEDVESTPEPEGDEPLDADEDPTDTLQLKNVRKHIKHEYWEENILFRNLQQKLNWFDWYSHFKENDYQIIII